MSTPDVGLRPYKISRSIHLENFKIIRVSEYSISVPSLDPLLRFTAQFTLWSHKIKKVYSPVYFFEFLSPDTV